MAGISIADSQGSRVGLVGSVASLDSSGMRTSLRTLSEEMRGSPVLSMPVMRCVPPEFAQRNANEVQTESKTWDGACMVYYGRCRNVSVSQGRGGLWDALEMPSLQARKGS